MSDRETLHSAVLAAFVLCGCVASQIVGSEKQSQLWDGKESVAEYAKRIGYPSTYAIDLGNAQLYVVLIPAANFRMGHASPESTWRYATFLGLLGAFVATLLMLVLVFRWRKRRRIQFSLRWYIVFIFALACITYSVITRTLTHEEHMIHMHGMPGSSPSQVCNVGITRPYYVGKFEVTVDQYMAVMQGGSSGSSIKDQNLPIVRVSIEDTRLFCERLSTRIGMRVRLPTEAEWEHACRAGRVLDSWDSDYQYRVAWHHGNSGGNRHAVGLLDANQWGVYDMLGNVWEYCEDNLDLSELRCEIDPVGSHDHPVARGGSFDTYARYCRCHVKKFLRSPVGSANVGFRVALDAESVLGVAALRDSEQKK